MRKQFLQALLVLAVCASTPVSAVTNLLVNGSFETPYSSGNRILGTNDSSITGWTTLLSGVEHFDATTYGGAADGKMVIDLANYVYSGGGIKQTFATITGNSYDLSFSLGNYLGFGRNGTGVVEVSIAGTNASFNTAVATSATTAWRTEHLTFTATSNETTLQFLNSQNAYTYFAFIDGVSVVSSVPEPETYAMFLLGLGILGAAARRRMQK